jgi:hypothetical protein
LSTTLDFACHCDDITLDQFARGPRLDLAL